MKIFVVIGDPDFHRHYESVHKSLEEAEDWILGYEIRDKVKCSPHLYGQAFFDKGRWILCDGEQRWEYPHYGSTHGIVVEDLEP